MFHCIEVTHPSLYPQLAMERFLLDEAVVTLPILMLWRGPRAVVMGKNQNPWRECNLDVIREKALLLGRRVSGGGAVYHDPGNLNFSWIVDRSTYSPALFHGILREVLAAKGLSSETAKTGGCLVSGKKVSGSAYCHRKSRVLHHGTLLWDADLETLRAALSAPRIRLQTHAVRSVPAGIANLVQFLPKVGLPEWIETFKTVTARHFGDIASLEISKSDVQAHEEEMASPEWIWGQTPQFSGKISMNTPGESADLGFTVRQGHVIALQWQGQPYSTGLGFAFDKKSPHQMAARTGLDPNTVKQAFTASGWTWLTNK
ncbi:MAG: hypothetical protein JJU29_00815 [Verrucomicrobia bacterium]|nr:hypothetical protein [Verrucomicrobiota bacterium]MCH8510552.1 hypothetical protein [Kiritimatiellia bacterium]